MKTRTVFIFISLFCLPAIFAQGVNPSDWGLEAFLIKHETLGDIRYYVTKNGIEQEKPLLLVSSGCAGLPIMLVVDNGEKSLKIGTVPPDGIHKFADQFHVAFIGKAGTPFCDTMMVKEINPIQNMESYKPSQEYVQKCGMEWEIKAISVVIDTLCKMLPRPDDTVIAMGMSEGGRLVTRLAAENDKITHLVSIVSGGLNQFYSSIINRRLDAAAGKMTHQEAQTAVDSLFAVYKRIYADPKSTEKWYYGHPYQRWGSFCNDIPLEHMLKLNIPILLVNGTADRNSPVLQADYVMLEFIRHGKTNLTYQVYPGVEHSLYEIVVENGEEKGVSRRDEIFKKITDWIMSS
ncbi:hypothetical protein JW935_15950 [candidate division KSB1 bacterium]|nr:hypothetical protein [candidate division KSB1 bacterium]